MSADNTAVRNVPEAGRYEITLDGDRVGFADYVDAGQQRIFHHTEIDEKFGGRGLAGDLVSAALTDTRAAGKRIVAVCPYVAKYVSKHSEFGDLVDPATPEALAAVEARN
ncbi:N-acetyltransferase [Mycobacterium sp. 21AC1]|uniref:GNAT family N-acetyltransferase n=1 Tax=[Mycobacterium] appelbergii TaxID=2939269 RepID=UPI0029390C3D|nr:GNAT family N-acetyltransferase [Mycobacterium sp. 21AC1]MDV3128612.1 N-acetyltransferase [Mycobacterium sp. 21AC1]